MSGRFVRGRKPTRSWRGFRKGKVGWGGRIRTFTVLINSEVSYQLDHAPAVLETASGKQAGNAAKKLASGNKIITRGREAGKVAGDEGGYKRFLLGKWNKRECR
jgi:hypothetical protein